MPQDISSAAMPGRQISRVPLSIPLPWLRTRHGNGLGPGGTKKYPLSSRPALGTTISRGTIG